MALGLFAVGCGSGRTLGGTPDPGQVTLARDVQPIFDASCAFVGCHGGSSPQQGMDLTAAQSHGNIVNVDSMEAPDLKRVKTGDSANSYLFQKLTQDNPRVGDRMPQGGVPLTAAELDIIRRWIDSGALP